MVEREKSKWWQLIWSVFVGFLFLGPIQRDASRLEWGLTVLGVLVFLALYVVAIAFWSKRASLAAIAGITLLGVTFAPTNPGACLFFIYAASFVPFALGGKAGASALLIGAILAIVGVESWLLNLHWHFWAYAVGYSVIIGIGNTWATQKSFTIERLAQIAERERIARDLHDVLGHTLSVIILKAELAGKLLDCDRDRAKTEIADVERISREALADVRNAIRGYRSEGLQAEFERSKSILETAGVTVECHSAKVPMTPSQESVLALVLREAVTNVVRHAQAKKCRLQLQEVNGACRLEIQDDGRGGRHEEGYGTRGMRERVEGVGGTLSQETDAGTKLTVVLPLSVNTGGHA